MSLSPPLTRGSQHSPLDGRVHGLALDTFIGVDLQQKLEGLPRIPGVLARAPRSRQMTAGMSIGWAPLLELLLGLGMVLKDE